jgi:predicted HicB family RNase H-like nuclease
VPKPAKPQIRVYINEETDRLLKVMAGIKDASVNAIVNEAIDRWLNEPAQKKIIEKFNLNQLDEID